MSKKNITPQLAKDWLQQYNTDNYRDMNPHTVEQYARDMRAGNWFYTSDAIKFDWDGILIDGQQRLAAVVEADVPIEFEIKRGLDPKARDYIDLGRKRTIGNILKNHGFANPNVLAAAKRLEIDIVTVRQGRGGQGRYATFPELIKMIEEDEHIRWVNEATYAIPNKLLTRSVAVCCYNMLHRVDKDDCAEFFHRFVTPANLPENSPILACHKRFTNANWHTKGRLLRLQQATVIFRAWNAWRKGDPRSFIRAVPNDEGKLDIPIPE